MHGKQGTTAHVQSDHDGSEKGHQSVGASHGGQGTGAEKTADDDGVGDIIDLLQQVSEDHRKCKEQKCF